MKTAQARLGALIALTAVLSVACTSETEVLVSTTVGGTTPSTTAATENTETTTVVAEPTFAATLGSPITDYVDPVDIAVRRTATLQSYIAERAGKIFELATDGSKGTQVLDISDLTIAQGEQGLLGLAFAPDGSSAYVNYTNLAGDTVIATMATLVGAGMRLRDAVPLANRAGGIVVGKFGTATVSYEELFV